MCTKEEYCGDIISESELLPNDRSMKSIEMESTETQAAARKRPKTTGLDEERMAACLFMKPIRVNAVNRLYLKEISGSQTLLQLENLVNHIEYIKGPPRCISVQCRDEDYSEYMNSFIRQINGEAVLLYKKANTRYFYLFTNEEAEEVKEFQYEDTQRAKIRYWRS
ncbi:hypothetical protein ABG067_001998 [Albugo candida]